MSFGRKEWFASVISILIITDFAILLNIPILRQILGFLFLTISPGLLILQILKLDKIESTEKFVLSVGLSISFLLSFGLLVNNLSLYFGYETPLAMIPLLISFNLAFIVLAIIGCKINKKPIYSLPNLTLNTSEKAFLIVPVLFPALSIFGMFIMNMTDNNTILMCLLFSIPIYIAFVSFFNQKFPKRLYPVVIFLISISLLLFLPLRSNHIIGADTHLEYWFFLTTLNNLHWSVLEHTLLDTCLSISLLPTIYQLILDISPEFLFKILHSLIYSISPLIIYVLSKKYVGEGYAFLASFFFMSQHYFWYTAFHSRANTAILFFALAMMVLFSDKIDPLKKRILFIMFLFSCVVSHYSTTYVFLVILFVSFMGLEILSKKYTFKKSISLTIVILFFALIFLWYSQLTEAAFYCLVDFVEGTFSNLNTFFVEESRSGDIQQLCLGKDVAEMGVPQKIEFFLTWMTSVFIGIGILTLIRRYKEMSFPEWDFKKPEFLKEKFAVEYFVIALSCMGLLVMLIAVPYISTQYSPTRLYPLTVTILSVFFVIGGITLSKTLFAGKKGLQKNASQQTSGKFDQNASSQVRAYLIILLVLIPYFLCVTGVMCNIFGVPREIILNSEGPRYDRTYIHDEDSYGAKWLVDCMYPPAVIHLPQRKKVAVDYLGPSIFISQTLSKGLTDSRALFEHEEIKGYIYLRYCNVVNGKLLGRQGQWYNLTEYLDVFIGKSNIYDNGGSEVYK